MNHGSVEENLETTLHDGAISKQVFKTLLSNKLLTDSTEPCHLAFSWRVKHALDGPIGMSGGRGGGLGGGLGGIGNIGGGNGLGGTATTCSSTSLTLVTSTSLKPDSMRSPFSNASPIATL